MDSRQYQLGQFSNQLPRRGYVSPIDIPNNFIQIPRRLSAAATGWREQVHMAAASMEEQRNLERVHPGLKDLILQEISAHNQQEVLGLTSSHLPISSWATPPGYYNFNSPYPPVNYFTDGFTDLYSPTPNCVSNSGFSEGSLYNGYSQGVVSTISASGISMQGIMQVAGEMNTSPGQISTITTCSDGDGFSETGPSDDGSIFPRSCWQYITGPSLKNRIKVPSTDQGFVENNHNANHSNFLSMLGGSRRSPNQNMMISQNDSDSVAEASNSLPRVSFTSPKAYVGSNSQLQRAGSQQAGNYPQQAIVQLDDNSLAQSHMFSVQQDDERCSQIAQLPQQLYGHFGPINVAKLTLSSRTTQRILLLYIKFKSMSANASNIQSSFLKQMHMRACKGQQCNCDQYSILIFHFEKCDNSACSICLPVRRLCSRGEVVAESGKRKRNLSEDFFNGEAIGTSTDTVVDALPPNLKRQKIDNNPVLNGVAPSVNQTRGPDRLPHLEQWHEAGLSSGDVNGMNKDSLGPTEVDQAVEGVNRHDAAIDNPLSSDLSNTLLLLEELISSRETGEIDDACGSEIINDSATTYEGFVSAGLPEKSEESSKCQKEDEEIKIRPNLDRADLEERCYLLEPAADSEVEMKAKEPKVQGVSWADYFSAEEMKQHMHSFGQRTDQEIGENVEQSLGKNICQLCAMDRLVYAPAPMYCSCCRGPIKCNLIYYQAPGEMGTQQQCFCSACYKSSRGRIISFHGAQFPKIKLLKKKNNEGEEESWVQCDKCECWQHQICALYNDKRDTGGKAEYICPQCWLEEIEAGEREPLPRTAAFGAKDLPRTKLGDHIEARLFQRLKKEREESGKDPRKKLYEVPGEADLAVRVVLSVDKKLEVKQQFLDILNGGNYPSEFLYRSKVILLFQRIQGVDVCLFGMYVQEYGSDCGLPNQRCVYISYIDSVKYLRPEAKTVTGEALRTLVYHEILIGYLDYCKKRGFSTCYIWACPPVKGEDYILYCHPESQKIPRPDKLRQWYRSMLKKAAKENVVVDYTNFYDCFFLPSGDSKTKITVARLPYFDGDYWSTTAEIIIRKFEKEGKGGGLPQEKRQMTKRTLKAMGHTTLSSDAAKDLHVMQKLGQSIYSSKDKFFVVRLQFFCTRCHEAILSGVRWFCKQCKNLHVCSRCLDLEQNLDEKKIHTSNIGETHILSKVVVSDVAPDTEDNDVISDNDLFENRHSFLSFCQGNHYQFDTLRRAKHSSMMILHHLHKPTAAAPMELTTSTEKL